MNTIIKINCLFLTLFFSLNAFSEEPYDPLEGMNRGIYSFNEWFDRNILEPVSIGYDYVTPDPVQTGVTNFFSNLKYPIYAVSDIFQGEITQLGNDSTRFILNTTVGLLGTIDVAKDVGFAEKKTDIGVTFGKWGISSGPYIVLPFIGPSNLRDTVGFVGESFLTPQYYLGKTGMDAKTAEIATYSLLVLRIVQTRVNLADAIKATREGSLDPYLFIQSSYYQLRAGQIGGKQEELE